MAVTENKYQYLFPFEKVPMGSNIIIYGAGIVGMEYLQQVLTTGYCNVVAMIDANAKEYSSVVVPVYPPDSIHTLKFERAVVALRGTAYFEEIKRNLLVQGVLEEYIVFVQRNPKAYDLLRDTKEECA